ncbi:prolipoprotein diacylglyceryl transferase [Pseudobutyrivibrio xylanivorans]|uniref:Phosphatidylglycerol--prolipoprotein diacylglyceryl transferase n=1 Tax=Pseudobutyrivibrio xylanivorans DSM 14809 TaxID=1123012 RepID=A0A1M6CKX2_PSEXY|nr:prolipoprotein diacylglyceryl transferase [Pseudobutyrivibrio xylanivorans]SHI61511.1 phosphatidylglycerol:prolipoprotein diacylglycerol transferase [Pseudobutyrivibrio xylanivorans DSM 14809]
MDSSIIFPNLHITLNNIEKGFHVGSFFIAFYGVIIAIGMLVGVTYILKMAKREGFDEDRFLDICIITIIVGVIGARLYYVIFAWEYYKDDFLSIFNIRQGGLAIYGGVLAGIASVAVLCKIRKHNFLQVMDICIGGVVIGQIFGRWGNFFNREVFGQYTDGLFAMLLPINSIRSQSDVTSEMLTNLVQINGVDYISVHPTFLYESLWNLGLFIIMFLMIRKKKFHGQVFFTYLLGYGAGRFWIEGIRTDQLKLWGTNIPVSQALAAILIVLGTGLYVYNMKKLKEN